jgi:hypothetical protein
MDPQQPWTWDEVSLQRSLRTRLSEAVEALSQGLMHVVVTKHTHVRAFISDDSGSNSVDYIILYFLRGL